MIREGFSLNPLVWLYVWTGSGDDVEKVRLPDPVSMRRYTLADKEKAEAMLINLVLRKIYTEGGEVHVAERYELTDVIPVLCHFIMARRPRPWTRLRRTLGLTDHSARTMRRLKEISRLDIRSVLDSACRLSVGPCFKDFERNILETTLEPILKKKDKPDETLEQLKRRLEREARRSIEREADFYYGLIVNYGLKLEDVRRMTMWEIIHVTEAAKRATRQQGPKGFDRIQQEMGRAPR